MNEINDKEDLVNLDDISIDENLPQNERILEFVRQIKNPYKFRCGKYTVVSQFRTNGPGIEDCFITMMT
jgi:hypothetical protein